MKKIIPFFVFIVCIIVPALAQNNPIFNLQPNIPESKEVVIRNVKDNFTLSLEFTWNPENNTMKLAFKRKSDGTGLFLCYSLMKNVEIINDMKECSSNAKRLWRDSKVKKEIKQMNYFFKSTDIELPYETCYKQLPCNNQYEALLNIKGSNNQITATLYFYVAKENKKKLSRRDVQLLYRAEPINVEINTIQVKDPCNETDEVLIDINTKTAQLETLQANLKGVQKNKDKCKECKRVMDDVQQKIILDFFSIYPKWEERQDCKIVDEAIKNYNILRYAILAEECPKCNTSSPCPKLEDINKRLMNLQMEITKKKVNRQNVENERKEFANIKAVTDKNITASCKKDLLDSYRSYCATIEKILNN